MQMPSLRGMFGPSRDEVWRQLSTEIQGRFIDGTWTKGSKVQAEHRDWTVTLDTFVVPAGKVYIPCTRMRVPFVNPSGFRFTVYRKSVFSGVAKLFGMQDIEIGDDEFDREFIVKGTDESHVRTLLSRIPLRELIAVQPDINLSVKDDEGWFATKFPEGVDELHFMVTGHIKDLERLKKLFDLFARILDALVEMGTATPDAADVKL
jgi:hypothetical protein